MPSREKFRLNKFVQEVNRNMNNLDEERDRGEASDSHTDLKLPFKPSNSNGKAKAFDRPPSYMSATTPLETHFPHQLPQSYREPSPPPPPRREYVERHRSGIWMPWSLFIILAIMLFLESTVLFTYTVIGLYNNTPTSVFAWAGVGTQPIMGTPNSACDQIKEGTASQQPAINFAPNFVMPQVAPPQQPAPAAVTVTVTNDPDKFPEILLSKIFATTSTTTSSSSSSSSSSTSSTSSVDPTSAAALLASQVASVLKNETSATSSSGDAGVKTVTAAASVVLTTSTATPSRSLTTMVEMLTVDASGHTLSPLSTITSTSGTSAPSSAPPPSSSNAESSTSSNSVTASSPTTSSAPAAAPPPTTITTVVPPPPPATSTTVEKKATSATPTPSSTAKAKGSTCPQNIWLVTAICARMVGE